MVFPRLLFLEKSRQLLEDMKKADFLTEKILEPWIKNLIELLPWGRLLRLGSLLGIAGYLVSGNRLTALSNLEIAFGKTMNRRRARQITLKTFQDMGRSMFEVFSAARLKPDEIKEMVPIEGAKNLEKVLSRGKGVVGFSGHLGNFALIGPRMAVSGYSFNYILRFPESRIMNSYAEMFSRLIRYLACRLKVGLIPANNKVVCVRQSLRRLKSNEIVCILGDQNKVDGIRVDFFGRPAGTAEGPVVLAMKSGAGIVPMFSFRKPCGAQYLVIEPEFKLDVSGDYNRDVFLNTARLSRMIEARVSAQPEQWWWTQRRWRTAEIKNPG